MTTQNLIKWPDGKQFAFTIFDDTDCANLADNKIIYDFFDDCGFRITKSVWMLENEVDHPSKGVTLEDKDYLDWVLALKNKGTEIAFHMASYNSSKRDVTIQAIDAFMAVFKQKPMTMANHSSNRENIYFGENRLSGFRKLIYLVLTRFRHYHYFQGEKKSSPYFWGDICQENIKYARNFVYSDINTLKKCPFMPYSDPNKGFVNYWFASSEANNVDAFNKLLSEKNQDQLEKEGGASIVYTHLAYGFVRNGRINQRTQELLKRLSQKNGWFVPVSELLDYLQKVNGDHVISYYEKVFLELKWLLHKVFVGPT